MNAKQEAVLTGCPGSIKITRMGRYEVRSTWSGNVLSYELYRNGLFYGTGIDRLSYSEELALKSLRERLS